jgi:hypothetical protein
MWALTSEAAPYYYHESVRDLEPNLPAAARLGPAPIGPALPGRTPRASNSSGNYVGCQAQVAKGDANEGSIKLLNNTP